MISEERIEKMLSTIARRQWDMTVILENVHDPHNLGAVMRSCESIGITEVYIVYTEETTNRDRYIGRNASGGVSKWIDAHFFYDLEQCFNVVRSKYETILATHLYSDSISIYEKDFTQSVALVFGNEHKGISKEALALSDGNIMIPMQGLAESLNVSVACSICLYEAMRQRKAANKYEGQFDIQNPRMYGLLDKFLRKIKPRIYQKNKSALHDVITNHLENK